MFHSVFFSKRFDQIGGEFSSLVSEYFSSYIEKSKYFFKWKVYNKLFISIIYSFSFHPFGHIIYVDQDVLLSSRHRVNGSYKIEIPFFKRFLLPELGAASN